MGTGAGIAFFMFVAVRTGNTENIRQTLKHVVLADWIFTTPAVVIQFVTGIWLMKVLGYSFASTWFYLVISLFLFVGVCWVPVVFIQIRLKDIAAGERTDLFSDGFNGLFKWWVGLGVPAFTAMLVLFYLMVFKPFLYHA